MVMLLGRLIRVDLVLGLLLLKYLLKFMGVVLLLLVMGRVLVLFRDLFLLGKCINWGGEGKIAIFVFLSRMSIG